MDDETLHRLTALHAAADLVRARSRALGELVSAPHRLEFTETVRGVEYINDSKATYLDASLASISAIEKPVVWITGALPEDVQHEGVRSFLQQHLTALVLFGADGSERVETLRPWMEQVYHASELRTAVFLAHELARNGDVVLFSPACASGEGFANYEERGHAFKRMVRDL